jgi:NADPH:quinone reductase-like Zn-dependent oxidoreductase
MGARVTAVCSTEGVDTVSSLGAGPVIDYTRQDFTAIGETFDVVFDAVGKTSFRRCRHLVKKGGVFVETDLASCGRTRF